MAKPDGSLNPTEAVLDNKCPLGQWLYGEGLKFAKYEEFLALKKEHTRFHKAVGEVIRHAASDQSVTAESTVGPKSEFCAASAAVVLAIAKLKRQVTA